MGLADGDLYVSGSILSFQQMKRIYQNFRAASVPSNLQAGALWSRSTDDRLFHQGTTLLEIYTEQSGTLFENLLSNSGFGVCSQSALTDIDTQIDVTDIAAGVCTTADTQNLQVGDLVKFNGGGTTGTGVYEVTALTVDTNFTINDTSITDGTNVDCDEATPAFIAADVKAPDSWTKTSTLDLYRWFNHSTYHKGMYGLQVTKGANGAEYLNAFGSIYDKDHHYLRFRGKTVTLGCWVYSVTAADNVKLQINDSGGTTESSFVAANTLTWVEITRTCGASITSFTPRILFDGDTSDVAYISRPMLIEGLSIGEGNYQPKQQEVVFCEAFISSNKFNATAGWSNTGFQTLNIEADTDGRIPKGCKVLWIHGDMNDLGSAGFDAKFYFQANATTSFFWICSLAGLVNDYRGRSVSRQPCDENGDVQYILLASGAGTFDITYLRYFAVQVN